METSKSRPYMLGKTVYRSLKHCPGQPAHTDLWRRRLSVQTSGLRFPDSLIVAAVQFLEFRESSEAVMSTKVWTLHMPRQELWCDSRHPELLEWHRSNPRSSEECYQGKQGELLILNTCRWEALVACAWSAYPCSPVIQSSWSRYTKQKLGKLTKNSGKVVWAKLRSHWRLPVWDLCIAFVCAVLCLAAWDFSLLVYMQLACLRGAWDQWKKTWIFGLYLYTKMLCIPFGRHRITYGDSAVNGTLGESYQCVECLDKVSNRLMVTNFFMFLFFSNFSDFLQFG